jgi:hypothetical protein
MKILEGAYYRTRGDDKNPGQVFGPMRYRKEKYCWYIGGGFSWDAKGHFDGDQQSTLDLISEVYVSDTRPENAPEYKNLRDEFAMEAMKLLIPRHERGTETLAEFAYRQADEMMEARKK